MRLKALSLLLLLGIVWGSGYAIARFCVTHGVAPLGYSFWQSLGPALVLLMFSFFKKGRKAFYPFHKLEQDLSLREGTLPKRGSVLLFGIMAGLLGIALPNSIMYFGSSHLPSSLVAIVVNTVPLFIYPFALIFKTETFNLQRMAWVLLGVCGLFILNFVPNSLGQSHLPWSLITLIAPLCFALCAVLIEPLKPPHFSAQDCAVLMLVSSSFLLIPIVVASHSFYPLHFTQAADFWILLEILLSSLGYILFFRLLHLAGPVYYSLVGGVVAITGVILGILIFKESLAMKDLIALLLILSAIAGMSLNKTIYA